MGRHRGGNSFIREYEYLGETEGLMSLRSDKRDYRPHGLYGGQKGTGPVSHLIRGEEMIELPVLVTEPYPLKKGDIFRHISPSGGGFGAPSERSANDIRHDLEAGLISAATAMRDYGYTA
ncbi:hydantoinase B/oxoprolinase family protein (plasmid) [Thioclava sp. 'Guangxiensis']|uniref:hydantoinase B/oxoprolinase family protein n=1 Tax=Thioclava sp. 'Guangxiensis' TaxID=3149044 RepID=UPI0032C43FC0